MLPKPKESNTEHVKRDSLLCLALMMPYSSEQGLLVMQHEKKMSIFQCDHFRIYSSQKIRLAPHLFTHKIYTTQKCEMGGQSGTALNTEIFMAFWRAVIEDGMYRHTAWTVKVDPDTVFFPQRLRPLLHKYDWGVQKDGLYLNNCGHGLHGPIEVLSQNAIRTLALKTHDCYLAFTGICHGPGDCSWGEDKWVDQCFIRFTDVKRVFAWQLLVEDHCDPWPSWRDCKDWNRVAFHPFKDIFDHQACVERAEATRPSDTSAHHHHHHHAHHPNHKHHK